MEEQPKLSIPAQQDTPMVKKRWCNTKCRFHKYIYTWTIEDFLTSITSADGALDSTVFMEKSPRNLLWQLHVEMKDTSVLNVRGTYIIFKVNLVQGDGSPVPAVFEFSILNPNGGKDYTEFKKLILGEETPSTLFYIKRNEIFDAKKTMIYDDRLTVQVTISIAIGMSVDSGSLPNHDNAIANLSEDLSRMLLDDLFCDVTLTVGSERFRAHRVLLAARSDVFAAMFQHDLLEKAANHVEIPDIDPKVFRELLRFIYTGEVSSSSVLEEMALELIAAADKYAVGDLKELCEKFLIRSISSKIAAEALVVAELHGSKALKKRAVDFIKANMGTVALTKGWFKIAAFPDLLDELATERNDQ